jgi:hypothetical protein
MTEETAPKPLSTVHILVALGVLVVLVAPILFIDYMPFVDYPNHAARIYIRANYDRVSLLQQTYRSHWQLSPYLAMDLIAVPLAHVMNIYWAARLFLIVLVLSFCAGCYALSASIQKGITWIAPIACFLVYDSSMLWGFLNYMFGVSVFMLVLAAWLRWRETWNPLKVATFVLLSLFCYLCHLIGYMVLGISIGFVALWDLWHRRTTLASAALSILPATLPLALFPLYLSVSGDRIATPNSGLDWSTLRGKLAAGFVMFRGYHTIVDLSMAAAWAALLLFLVIKRRDLWFYKAGVGLGALLLALFLALPRGLTATGNGDKFDGRFVLPGGLLLLFSICLISEDRLRRIAIVAALTLSIFRLSLLTHDWRSLSNRIESASTLFASIPEGARVYPAVYRTAGSAGSDAEKIDFAFMHVLCYAIIERRIVDPELFEAGQLLEMRDRPPYSLWSPGQDLTPLYPYQYVWSYAEPAELRALLVQSTIVIGEREGFTLWKLPAASPPAHAVSAP